MRVALELDGPAEELVLFDLLEDLDLHAAALHGERGDQAGDAAARHEHLGEIIPGRLLLEDAPDAIFAHGDGGEHRSLVAGLRARRLGANGRAGLLRAGLRAERVGAAELASHGLGAGRGGHGRREDKGCPRASLFVVVPKEERMETRAELARRVTVCVSRGLRLGGAYLTLRVVDANVRETHGRFRSGSRRDARTRFAPNIHSRARKKNAIFMAARFQPIKTSHFAIEAKRRWTWALGEVSPSDLKIRSDLS